MWFRYIAIQSMVYCARNIETVTIITQLDILSAAEAYNKRESCVDVTFAKRYNTVININQTHST